MDKEPVIHSSTYMESTRNYDSYLKKMHNKWLGNLAEYGDYLHGIDVVTLELQMSVNDIEIQSDLILVRNAIVLEKNTVNELRAEIMGYYKKAVINRQKIYTINDVRENNFIRDRIGKVEQSVFMLKYHVNKLLSLAS